MLSNYFKYWLLTCSLLCSLEIYADSCPIIPQPKTTQLLNAVFILDETVGLENSTPNNAVATYFKNQLNQKTGIHLAGANSTKTSKRIVLVADEMLSVVGSYQLNMTAQSITLKAGNGEGFFNGLNSLLQLIEVSRKEHKKLYINCWSITDEPRFQWRGFMLDEARHFFGINKVKQLLDWMAYYKLNRFHWHLTDQQGWRLSITKYPKLTNIGGVGNFSDTTAKAAYYTQAEIKEIVNYAKERYITVIPEIDMPGHATAANKAYPEFNGGGSADYPNFTFNPGNKKTYGFLTDILRETSTLFPSKMIHLGGDEVEFGAKAWVSNADVKNLMQVHNLKNIQEVEHYFFNRMADSVKSLGSRVLAWDEAVDASLDPKNTLIFWWRHDKKEQLQKAIAKGFSVILCPRLPMYFDFVQDQQHQIGRKWKAEFNSLQAVYEFPSSDLLYQHALVQGIQANLWTETINNTYRFDFMTFPRIAALAEAAWTPNDKKDFMVFQSKLKTHLKFYQQDNINYYNPFEKTSREK